MKRLRVLISAHEFSPDQGSECAVGWNISTRLAEYHDVTVLCADGPPLYPNAYRNAVINYLDRHGTIPGLNVVFVGQPAVALRYARLNHRLMSLTRGVGWQPLYYMGLEHWHREALRTAQSIFLESFNVVHQLTPISFRRPGYLWISNVPFFWGPVGGMYKVPDVFARLGGPSAFLFEKIRSANIEREVRSTRFYRAVQKARRIWTITEDERSIVDAVAGNKAAPMIDTAPPSEIVGSVRKYEVGRPLRLCWSGRHETFKALQLFLRALALLREEQHVILEVLGEGPETERWKGFARKLHLENVIWHGRLPYSQALQMMGRADVFVHSSYREAASMVVLEALGWGLPVLCHDTCGMAVAVNETCGIKIPLVNPEQSIEGFRDALERILHNPELVEQLSKGALKRAAELSWDVKVREIAEAYTQI